MTLDLKADLPSGVAAGPLSPEQWDLVRMLERHILPAQAEFVSAHFAGLRAAQSPALTVTILFATETGNCEYIAKNLARDAGGRNISTKVIDLADYDIGNLAEEACILAIASTTGEGEAPYSAGAFFEAVEKAEDIDLSHVRFSVLALGDSTYADFCKSGRVLDEAFERLGASRIAPRVDCDLDFEDDAAEWSRSVIELLTATAPAASPLQMASSAQVASRPERHHTFAATVLDNRVLTLPGSTKATRHIVLKLPEGEGAYQPGDAIGVLVRNDPVHVAELLGVLGLDGQALVTAKGEQVALSSALEQTFEIGAATPRFLETWANLSGASELAQLLGEENQTERFAFLHAHHVIDIVRQFPVTGVIAQDFVGGLRTLQPRLYSIASSARRHPGEVHITLGPVQYELHGSAREGVASAMLCKSAIGAELSVFIQPNDHFRLPDGDEPIIMIGAGTGVAPYRGFLQERKAQKQSGPAWLFFGERNRATDFLYEDDWNEFIDSGCLSRIDTAFSRDGAEKCYVQHRMIEQADELFRWIEQGACIYVCGDAASLGPDVHAALLDVFRLAGKMSAEQADVYIRDLASSHRYLRDVY